MPVSADLDVPQVGHERADAPGHDPSPPVMNGSGRGNKYKVCIYLGDEGLLNYETETWG
jgi:hypothetical protein